MMTTRLRTYGWMLAFILGFFFCLKIVKVNEENSDSPAVLSRRTLSYYNASIGFVLSKGDASLSARLNRYGDMSLITALMELIASDESLVAVSKKLSQVDAWGNLYNVEWRTNMVDIVSPMLQENNNELLIWSSGANGINEYGHGDDIYEGQDWTIYRNDNQ